MKKKIYIITWVDSYSNSRWYNDKEIDEFIKGAETEHIVSVGFLYRKTKDSIILFGDKSPDEKGRLIIIRRKSIISIKKVKIKL